MSLNHLCLLIGTYLSSLPSHRDWEIGKLPPLVILFQRDGSKVLEKDILVIKLARTWEISISKGRERMYNSKLSKVNDLRKGRS